MARAEAAGADALAVFTAASDAFTEHNIGLTIAESLAAFRPVLARATELGWWRRAYVSTAFGCPYLGRIAPRAAIEVALRLVELGAEEICFGDTIGVAVPDQVEELTELAIAAGLDPERIAYHFHDTRGTALANVAAGLRAGIRTFDASTGGTGGCPYARVPRAISRPRISSTSWTRRAGSTASGSPVSSTRPASSPACSGGRWPQGRPGRRLGSDNRRRLAAALIASAPWTVPSSC